MLTSGPLARHMAAVTAVPAATVAQVVRNLRASRLFTTTNARGVNAPPVTSLDVARLLIVLLVTESPALAVQVATDFGGLRLALAHGAGVGALNMGTQLDAALAWLIDEHVRAGPKELAENEPRAVRQEGLVLQVEEMTASLLVEQSVLEFHHPALIAAGDARRRGDEKAMIEAGAELAKVGRRYRRPWGRTLTVRPRLLEDLAAPFRGGAPERPEPSAG